VISSAGHSTSPIVANIYSAVGESHHAQSRYMLSDEFCWNFCCSAKVIQRFKFLAREHKQATQIPALSQAWRDVLVDPHYMERRHFQFRFHKGETAFNVTFSLVLSIVSLILVNRSFSASLVAAFRRPNPALAWIILAITVILSLTLLWPPISALFQFGPLHIDDLALTIFGGAFVLLVLEALKHLWRRRLAF
jgi:magnesium-transporting ATPase (P-type)